MTSGMKLQYPMLSTHCLLRWNLWFFELKSSIPPTWNKYLIKRKTWVPNVRSSPEFSPTMEEYSVPQEELIRYGIISLFHDNPAKGQFGPPITTEFASQRLSTGFKGMQLLERTSLDTNWAPEFGCNGMPTTAQTCHHSNCPNCRTNWPWTSSQISLSQLPPGILEFW